MYPRSSGERRSRPRPQNSCGTRPRPRKQAKTCNHPEVDRLLGCSGDLVSRLTNGPYGASHGLL